jgi:hypothetical protein
MSLSTSEAKRLEQLNALTELTDDEMIEFEALTNESGTASKRKFSGIEIPAAVGMRPSLIGLRVAKKWKDAKIGDTIEDELLKAPITKVSDKEFVSPEMDRADLDIQEKLVESGPVKAAIRAGVLDVPSAVAGVKAAGTASRAASAIPNPIVRYGAPLVAGAGAAILTRLAQDEIVEGVAPSVVAQAQKDFEENPTAVTAGSILSSLPLFGVGPGVRSAAKGATSVAGARTAEAAISGTVGGAVQAGTELVNAPEDELLAEGAGTRIAMAAGLNAMMNKPTKLGESLLGSKPSIITKIDSGTKGMENISREANEIAMGEDLTGFAPVEPKPSMEFDETASTKGRVLRLGMKDRVDFGLGEQKKPSKAKAAPAPSEDAKAVAPEAAPQPEAQWKPRPLPRNLTGARPRYNIGVDQYEPAFTSDVEKALFITSQRTKSKKDGEYRKFLRDQGYTDSEIDSHGSTLRAVIKDEAMGSIPGSLPVPWNAPEPASFAVAKAKPAPKVAPDQATAPKAKPAEPTIPPPTSPEVSPLPGDDLRKIRSLHRRAPEVEQISDQVKAYIGEDPDRVYEVRSWKEAGDRAVRMTEPELVEMTNSADKFEKASAHIELSKRSSDPKVAAGHYSEASKLMTEGGQLTNLAKLVRSPAAEMAAAEQRAKKVGRELTDDQKTKVFDLAKKDIDAHDELGEAAKRAKEDWSDKSLEAYKKAKEKAGLAKKELEDYNNTLAPESMADILAKIVQGNLLTPLSIAANVYGNFFWNPIRRGALSMASIVDSGYTGLMRAVGVNERRAISATNPLPSARELGAGYRGLKTAAMELVTGPSNESYLKSEVQRGFAPLRALAQAFTGKDMAVGSDGKVMFSDRLKKLIEGTLGIPPEIMFRLLNLGDKPFRRAAEMEALLNEARLRGIKEGPELDKFLEFPSPAAERAANEAMREAIFMQENKGLSMVSRFLDEGAAKILKIDQIPALATPLKVLGRMIVPFRQFPVNYLLTAMNFVAPELALAKGIIYSAKGDKKRGLTNLAQGAIGASMYVAADWMWENGIISEPSSKDAKSRSVQGATMGASRINLSGLQRALDGDDPAYRTGDLTMDWTKLGIPAAVFAVRTGFLSKERTSQAKLGMSEKRPTTAREWAVSNIQAFPDLASFGLDQSFLAGVAGFLEVMKEPDPEGSKFQNWANNMFRVVSAIPVPNTMEAIARAQMEYIPELRGDGQLESFGNIWAFKTMQLPEEDRQHLKVDLWGDPVKRSPDSSNKFAYQLFDVTRLGRMDKEPWKDEIYKVFDQTNHPDAYPNQPTRVLSNSGIFKKLDIADYTDLSRMQGENSKIVAQALAYDPVFQAMEPYEKLVALKESYSEAAATARAEFLAKPGIIEKYFPEILTGEVDTDRTVSISPESVLFMGGGKPLDAKK